MSLTDPYTPAERERIGTALRSGETTLLCPRCGARLNVSIVSPTAEVSYVRKRALVVCTACHRSAAADLAKDR